MTPPAERTEPTRRGAGVPDVLALVAAGVLEEVRVGLYRRPRVPARDEVHGQQSTTPDADPSEEPREFTGVQGMRR